MHCPDFLPNHRLTPLQFFTEYSSQFEALGIQCVNLIVVIANSFASPMISELLILALTVITRA
ncbi:hypothetical protein SynBIOSU31_03054 [Synechococcus sp. BIOS-U3-1]|nr:hypothetical protein SynBIOSU31_03054 [Synechococcus sp. BIOS-U3-1]